MKESIIYYSVKFLGFIIRLLPLGYALAIGRGIGILFYYFDRKHRAQVYANLKTAFANEKDGHELKKITKKLFKNYGQNLIDLLRLPLLNKSKFSEIVSIEGKEHVEASLKKGRGVILLAMHFGSWELASLSCAMLGHPYKVIVKPQHKYSRIDRLLNSYRECGGSIVLSRGIGTRDLIKSLKNNEVVGMVVDQGGRDGVLAPFFGKQASMSVGAIRIGLKFDVPICCTVIIREKNHRHRIIIDKPIHLDNTGNIDKDIQTNLRKVTAIMEEYVRQYPEEYMWFYKIWKYSNEAAITILSDDKIGHLRQSQMAAQILKKIMADRHVETSLNTTKVVFKTKSLYRIFSVLAPLLLPFINQNHFGVLRHFLNEDSYNEIMTSRPDFVISCGSSLAAVNTFLSLDNNAKSICILKPGLMSYENYDLVILPQHDVSHKDKKNPKIVVSYASLNLITPEYLNKQKELLLTRFSHLKNSLRKKIGVFIGGDAKDVFISLKQIRILISQLSQAADNLNADILITTSRRTPPKIETLLAKELKRNPSCQLLILANQNNIPEAVGGILGLSDIVVVSGDSISMISEAVNSGKETIVFIPCFKEKFLPYPNKHKRFIDKLSADGYIFSSNVKDLCHNIIDIAKGKIHTRRIDDCNIITDAIKQII